MGVPGNVVCDLDGVVYLDDQPIRGSGAALTSLEDRGYRILLVTNNATRHVSEVASRVASITGYSPAEDRIISAALAGASLIGPGTVVLVVGEAGLTRTIEEAGATITTDWRDAEAVVVGLDRHLTYERLRDATLAVRAGARFVATNLDATFPTPGGQWPGGGAISAALAVASGTEPEVAGKPHAPMRRLVAKQLGPGPTWMVGDRPETDLAMGRLEGWTTVLVLSGIIHKASEVPAEYAPDLVLGSIAELPRVLP